MLPEILKRQAAVVFDAAEVALATQKRGVDVDEIDLAFKAVFLEMADAVKVVAVEEKVPAQARAAVGEPAKGDEVFGWTR